MICFYYKKWRKKIKSSYELQQLQNVTPAKELLNF